MDRLLTIDQVLEELEQYSHKKGHIHHTWSPNHGMFTGSNYQALQDGMRNYHMGSLNWSDIGQHLTVYPDGMCMTGRDWNRTPASIKNYNKDSFAAEFIGNFDAGNDILEGKQRETMVRLVKFFEDNRDGVLWHNEKSVKTCPGTTVIKSEILAEAADYGKTFKLESWAVDAVAWAIEKGITTDTEPSVDKQEYITMLYRYHTR